MHSMLHILYFTTAIIGLYIKLPTIFDLLLNIVVIKYDSIHCAVILNYDSIAISYIIFMLVSHVTLSNILNLLCTTTLLTLITLYYTI